MGEYDPRWGDAIASIETGGRSDPYRVLGPRTRTGDQAHGKFQVMGANIGEWSEAALGRRLTPQEFLADDRAQEDIFKHRFGGYVDKYSNPQDAASAWFTGQPRSASVGQRKDILGTTGNAYVDKFDKAMGATSGVSAINNAAGIRPTGSTSMMGYAPDDRPALSQTPPGALSPGAEPAPYNWGERIQAAGAALASIGSPAQGAALGNIAALSRKTARNTGTWSMGSVDPITGIAPMVNSLTGETRTQKIHEPKPEKLERVDPSALKGVSESAQSMNLLHDSVLQADKYKKAIDSGELDLSLLGVAGANFDSMFGKGSKQAELYNGYQSFRTAMSNDSLRQNNGTQTEGDAQRARQELVGTFGQYDNKSQSNALHNFIRRSGETAHKSSRDTLDSYESAYTNKKPFEVYRKGLDAQSAFYEEYAKRITAGATPAAASAGAAAATGTAPANRKPLGDIFNK